MHSLAKLQLSSERSTRLIVLALRVLRGMQPGHIRARALRASTEQQSRELAAAIAVRNLKSGKAKMAETTVVVTTTVSTPTTTMASTSGMITTTAITSQVVVSSIAPPLTTMATGRNWGVNVPQDPQEPYTLRLVKSKHTQIHQQVSVHGFTMADLEQVEHTEEQLARYWNAYENAHMDYMQHLGMQGSWAASMAIYDEIESQYGFVKLFCRRERTRLIALQASSGHSSVHGMTQNNNNSGIQLETIKVPKFDGLAHNWAPFKNLFLTMVHNTNIPEMARLQALSWQKA